jgi:hypothetical protein
MNGFEQDLIITLIGVAVGKILDEVVEILKERASKKRKKH